MAKLSARGRTEVFRVMVERQTPNSELTSKSVSTKAIMSDRTVLEKRKVWWRDGSGTHDWGWKRAGKLRAHLSFEEARAILLRAGWSEIPTFLSPTQPRR